MIDHHRIIMGWLRWLKDRRYAREAEAAERKRAAIRRAIARRKSERREWVPMLGELKDATNRALAAECGREWR